MKPCKNGACCPRKTGYCNYNITSETQTIISSLHARHISIHQNKTATSGGPCSAMNLYTNAQ